MTFQDEEIDKESRQAVAEVDGGFEGGSEMPLAEGGLLEDVTQLYLNEIGAKPLLTPEDELKTTRLVRAGDFPPGKR
jgi:RNA polymerase nonessential primary-like sigma factor